MSETASNNKRIAKNTLFLFIRTLFLMFISLFTSRVVLSTLGVEDYGIYSVVGSFVAMFSVISGALSSSISRFITFELGRANTEKLNKIFSTSINVQLILSLILIIIGETIGLWFLNNRMNIPESRLIAANWVLQCSIISFVINLISLPYNATIIAHEKMKAFAYVSILEAIFKLLIVYLLLIYDGDILILYSIMHVFIALCIRMVYSTYCMKKFEECHYRLVYDRTLLREMFSFAGWNFLTNGAHILNNQGISILINLFFGVAFNAARGIANQVDSVIIQFVNNFTTAINPQIIKSYAAGKKEEMFLLVCQGAKFSFFLLLILALPVLMETPYILSLWLKEVPDYTVVFIQLALVGVMFNMIGNSGYTACMATGNIKLYVVVISSIALLVLPISWVAFKFGMPVESAYVAYIFAYVLVDIVRLFIMRHVLDFPLMLFVREVFLKIGVTTLIAIIPPLLLVLYLPSSFLRFSLVTSCSIVSSIVSIYLLGLNTSERGSITRTIKSKFKRL